MLVKSDSIVRALSYFGLLSWVGLAGGWEEDVPVLLAGREEYELGACEDWKDPVWLIPGGKGKDENDVRDPGGLGNWTPLDWLDTVTSW